MNTNTESATIICDECGSHYNLHDPMWSFDSWFGYFHGCRGEPYKEENAMKESESLYTSCYEWTSESYRFKVDITGARFQHRDAPLDGTWTSCPIPANEFLRLAARERELLAQLEEREQLVSDGMARTARLEAEVAHWIVKWKESEAQRGLDQAEVVDSLRDLLCLLGLGDHARPTPPAKVFKDEVLPAVRNLIVENQSMEADVSKAYSAVHRLNVDNRKHRSAILAIETGLLAISAGGPPQDLMGTGNEYTKAFHVREGWHAAMEKVAGMVREQIAGLMEKEVSQQ